MTKTAKFILCLAIISASLLLAGTLTSFASKKEITVYKSPTCGCCTAWSQHLRENGFDVTEIKRDNMTQLKVAMGLPLAVQSCHTATVDGYLIEGHVPAADIHRLLEEKPDAKGLAVPGMPIGSPGMEQGDYKEPYKVIIFDEKEGRVFSQQN